MQCGKLLKGARRIMSENEKYNGWTGKGNRASAYATWRVNLEICDDYCNSLLEDIEHGHVERFEYLSTLRDTLEELVTELVTGEDYDQQNLATQYAMAFLGDVSWYEIAEHWEDELVVKDEEEEAEVSDA
jgi:hypothetical protein